jgi:hypothetical protein
MTRELKTLRPPFGACDVPYLVVSLDFVRGLAIDHRAGYVLSLIDGQTNVESICDIACVPSDDVVALLTGWRGSGVIAFR